MKALRKKAMDYLKGNNDPNDCEFLIKNHGGQKEVDHLVTRIYKALIQLNDKKTIQ